MKRWLIALAILLAGGSMYLWRGPPNLGGVVRGNKFAAFAHDMHEFAAAHTGRLPTDWVEFDNWTSQRDGKRTWNSEQTQKHVRLLAPPYAIVDGVPHMIEILDPDMKGMEGFVNLTIAGATTQPMTTNSFANQGLDRTASPERPAAGHP